MNPVERRAARPLAAATLIAVLAAAGMFPAWAQDSQKDPPKEPPNPGPMLQLDGITVTARKRPEPLRDVPFSVDVMTGSQLQETRSLDAEQALRNIGGVGFSTVGDRTFFNISMRGVGPVQFALSPDDSSVLTFLDGAPLSLASSHSAYLDLQRVEVLKGPQSTLFGRNTSGGAINLVPVEPSDKLEGYVLGEYGTGNVYRIESVVSGPIIPGILSGRVAFRRNAADGYIENIAGPNLGQEGTIAGRASLLLTASPQTRWLLSYSGEKTELNPVFYALNANGYSKIAAQNFSADQVQTGVINSKIEHEFDWAVLTAQTSFSWFKGYETYNGADYLLGSQLTGLPMSAFYNTAINGYAWTKYDNRFTQELRLSSVPDARISWLAGIVYYQDKANWDRQANYFLYSPLVSGMTTFASTTTGQAIFGELTYPVLEKLKISAGLRLSREEKTFDGQYFTDGAPGSVPYFAEYGSQLYQYWTGRLAVAYDWAPEFVSFANVARGYKPGGFGYENALIWAGIPRTPYGSSTVMSYEIGSRATLFDKKLRINGALFFNDVTAEQILAWDFMTFTTQNLNIDTQSYGFELDANFQIDRNWEVSAGTAYTHATFRNVSAQVAATQPGLHDGDQLPNVPRWTAKAAIGYRAPMSSFGLTGAMAESTLMARVEYNYIGPRYTDAANIGQLEAVNLLSARIGVDWKGKELYAFGQNLLNQQYTIVNQPFGASAVTGNQILGASWARGAVVGVGLQAKF